MKYEIHLSEIFLPTPSGTEKLLGAWDDLDFNTKVKFLYNIEDLHYPSHLAKKIYEKGFAGSNIYIRYLCAKKLKLDSPVTEKIESDDSPLVRYCVKEDVGFGLIITKQSDIDNFYALCQEERLAVIRNTWASGESIAILIESAPIFIESCKISQEEVIDILWDYLRSPKFVKTYKENNDLGYDGWAEYSKGKDIECLWQLLLKVPFNLCYPLLIELPESAGLGNNICENILEKLEDKSRDQALYVLFSRKDIGLENFRKNIFFDVSKKYLHFMAVMYNFDLTYKEFSSLIPNYSFVQGRENKLEFNWEKDEKKINMLKTLVHAKNLSWVYYQAICDLFLAFPTELGSLFEQSEEPDRYLEDLLRHAKNNTDSYYTKNQSIALKLYELAKLVAPWKSDESIYTLGNEFEFLKKAVITNDRWKTFSNFVEQWKKQKNESENFEKFLPKIYGFDEETLDENEPFLLLKTNSEGIQYNFSPLSEKIAKLEKTLEDQKNLLYIVIGMCIILLWKLYL